MTHNLLKLFQDDFLLETGNVPGLPPIDIALEEYRFALTIFRDSTLDIAKCECFTIGVRHSINPQHMASVQIRSDIDLDQLLEGVSQLDTADLRQFLTRAHLLLAQRHEVALPSSESDLLQRINQGLPYNTQHRYDELRDKLRREELSAEEHKELLELVHVVEQAQADRLQHLIALSQLRQVSLEELMQQLDIQQSPVHV